MVAQRYFLGPNPLVKTPLGLALQKSNRKVGNWERGGGSSREGGGGGGTCLGVIGGTGGDGGREQKGGEVSLGEGRGDIGGNRGRGKGT